MINLQIYSNANNTTKTIVVDFVAEIAAIADDIVVDDNTRYFFKFTTSAKDTDNLAFTPRIVANLSDLALHKEKQSASNVASAYSNVKAMIVDYVYDYIHGHTLGQYNTSVAKKAPMKFT